VGGPGVTVETDASAVIDLQGTSGERWAARAKDTEKNWAMLVDDPSWHDEPGVGGFVFLNESSSQYYLAPAMIRAARRGYGAYLGSCLWECSMITPTKWRWDALTALQRNCVITLAEYMMAAAVANSDDHGLQTWQAIRAGWTRPPTDA
jgi:hypothetical protein